MSHPWQMYPPIQPHQRSRKPFWIVLSCFVVALALLVSLLLVAINTKSVRSDFNASVTGGTPLTVEAQVSGGEVVATPSVGEAPNVPFVKDVAPPVHLEVQGGVLESATLTFPLSEATLQSLGGRDPEAALDILTRSESTGEQWTWAGPGVYDAATRTLSVEVEHFSDWTYAVTDFDAIAREARIRTGDGRGIGWWLGTTIAGDLPTLSCPKDEVALSYGFGGEFGTESLTPVDVCITYNHDLDRIRVELANQTASPYKVTLPPGLTAVPDYATGRGLFSEVYASTYYGQTGNVVLRPESKLVLEGPPDEVKARSIVNIEFDGGSYVGDMSAFITDLLFISADFEEADAKSAELKTVMSSKEYLDCIDGVGNEFEDAIRLRTIDMKEVATTAFLECAAIVVKKGAEFVQDHTDTKSFLNRAAGWTKKRVSAIFDIPQIAQNVREEIDGLYLSAGKFFGMLDTAGVDIILMPPPPTLQLHEALPPPLADDPDTRETRPVQRHLLLPEECAEYEFEWFVQYPGMLSTAAAGTGSYRVGPYNIDATLLQIESNRTIAVRDYVANLPRSNCSGNFGSGTPVEYYYAADNLAYDVSRVYGFYMPSQSGEADQIGYHFMAQSGEYLADIRVYFDEGTEPSALPGAWAEVNRILVHLDLLLPTDFKS